MLIKKYLCIFCNKRINVNSSFFNNGHIGICTDCLNKLFPTPRPPLFNAEGNSIDYVISPLFYKGRLRDLIMDLKFNNCRAYAEVLSDLMCNLLNDMSFLADFDFVVPVPLSKKRFTERGYNQSALLAEPFARMLGIPMCEDILFKPKHTKRQSRVEVSERFTNVRNSFKASDLAKNKRILLFDDILTTGSTLKACADTLKDAEASDIVGITLSVTEKNENILNIMY